MSTLKSNRTENYLNQLRKHDFHIPFVCVFQFVPFPFAIWYIYSILYYTKWRKWLFLVYIYTVTQTDLDYTWEMIFYTQKKYTQILRWYSEWNIKRKFDYETWGVIEKSESVERKPSSNAIYHIVWKSSEDGGPLLSHLILGTDPDRPPVHTEKLSAKYEACNWGIVNEITVAAEIFLSCENREVDYFWDLFEILRDYFGVEDSYEKVHVATR